MSNGETFYFDAGGQTLAIPSTDQEALARVQQLGLSQISEFEASKRKFTREYEDSVAAPLLYGAAKGLTFGTAPGLLTKAGLLEPGEAAGIEEAAPVLTTGAEIATGIASVLATGGTGAAAQAAGRVGAKEVAKRALAGAAAPTRKLAEAATAAGKFVGTKAASKAPKALQSTAQALAPLAVASTIEGAVYGAGAGISEAIIQNPEATAEDILSSSASGAVSGSVYGGLFGGGLGALALTAKGATNIASSIYRSSVEKHGQKFADRVADFISSADPESRDFIANELQNVLSFQTSYSDLTDALRNAEDRVAQIRQQGLDATAERAAIGVVKAQLQEQIRQLGVKKAQATKAVTAIQRTLRDLSKRTGKAAQKGADDFLSEAAADIDALEESRQQLASALGEVGERGEKLDVVVRETAGDSALKNAMDEAVQADPDLPGQMQQNARTWVNETVRRLRGIADGIANPSGKSWLNGEADQALADLEKINDAFNDGNYFLGFLLQRRLRRNLNTLPTAFTTRADIPDIAKKQSNQVITAIQPADAYVDHIGSSAMRIEGAKNSVQSALMKLARLGKPPSNQAKLAEYVSTVQKQGSIIVAAIRETPELAKIPEVQEIFQRFSGSIDGVASKSEALAEYNAAIDGMRQVLGLGADFDADTLQQMIDIADEKGIRGIVGERFDKAVEDLRRYVDRLDDPEALADQIEELKQRKAQEAIQQNIISAQLRKAKAELGRDESVTLANIDRRKAELTQDALAGGALLDIIIGGMIPNFLSYGVLALKGVKALRERPTLVLRGTAGILAATSKVNNLIRSGAQKTLKAVSLDDFDAVKYQRKGSILGKVLGQSAGIIGTPYQTPTDEAYNKSVAKIKELQTNSDRMMQTIERVASGGQNVESLRGSLAQTTQRAINYLGTFTPELAPSSPFDRYEPVPTPELKMRYGTAIEVVNNPVNAYYYALSRNLLDQQVLEPLRAIYPDLYTRLQQQTIDTFVENRGVLPYATRVQLGMAYGQGMDPTVAPQFVGAMQQMYTSPGQEQGGGVNMTQGGVGQLRKSAAAFQTPGQRMMEA